MTDAQMLIRTLIAILHDGQRVFADFSQHMKDDHLKAYFLRESQIRRDFALELEATANPGVNIGGTVSGLEHRVWGDLKAGLGGGDHTLLVTAEKLQEATLKAYKELLKNDAVKVSVRQVLERQQEHIRRSRDQVEAYRDSAKLM
jgi:uncharacterized protein (TIGR02284 family)